MNSETLVLIVTMICLMCINDYMPRAGKKGLLFGAIVEESQKKEEPFLGYIKSYRILNIVLGLIFFIIIILGGVFTSEILQIIGMLGYLIVNGIVMASLNKKIKIYKKEHPINKKQVSVVRLENFKVGKTRIIYYVILSVVTIVINLYYMITRYGILPEMVPMKYDLAGKVTSVSQKSIGTVSIIFLSILMIVAIYIFSDWIIYKIMFKIDPKNKEDSYKANLKTKQLLSIMLGVTIIPVIVSMTIVNLITFQAINMSIFKIVAFIQAFTLIGVIGFCIIVVKARNNYKIKDENVTYKNDDDYWKFGFIYYNKNNPSVFVEKRMGIGVTINAGTLTGMIIYIGIIVLIIGSILMPFIMKLIR